jgi:hypothetical protein
MRLLRVLAATALAAATALVMLGGCGSNSLSEKQLRAHAASVCTAASRRANRIPTPTDPADGSAFLKSGITALQPEVIALKALRPPHDVADVYEASVRGVAQQLSMLELTLRHLRGGQDPVVAIKTLQEHLAPIEASADSGWQTLEIPACIGV